MKTYIQYKTYRHPYSTTYRTGRHPYSTTYKTCRHPYSTKLVGMLIYQYRYVNIHFFIFYLQASLPIVNHILICYTLSQILCSDKISQMVTGLRCAFGVGEEWMLEILLTSHHFSHFYQLILCFRIHVETKTLQ